MQPRPEELKPEHGFHQDCYQRFTKNLDCLQSSTEDSETLQQSRTSRCSLTASEKVIFKPDCTFCNKERQKKIKDRDAGKVKHLQSLNAQSTVGHSWYF